MYWNNVIDRYAERFYVSDEEDKTTFQNFCLLHYLRFP
jgi:hypothetical protein